ncbi:DMT family transporter [Fretibacter rubidus]|uniref:DMT family transporter n=1 Tax=Fretibacter rubidus TaxID=570162 RepID=UPI00352B8508
MKLTDFFIMMACCLAWGGNFVVSAWALGNYPVPPFMLAAIRAILVLLLMGWVLFQTRPEKVGLLLIVCACVGPIHLGFLYTGLQTASASGSSIISQILIPFATLLSVAFLGERVGWRRSLAIIGAIIGVVIMVYEPGALRFDIGLIYIIAAYFALAVGSVVMKRVGNVDWKQYVTWMALVVLIVMAPASLVFEAGHAQIWAEAKGPLLIAAGYAAICVTILAHGQYFRLVRAYDISQIVPLTLMTTVFACILGVVFLKEQIYLRYLLGAVLILPCVLYIARKQTIVIIPED